MHDRGWNESSPSARLHEGNWSFSARTEPYSFAMPRQVVPTTVMAKGDYHVNIRYAADNFSDDLLTRPELTIHIT